MTLFVIELLVVAQCDHESDDNDGKEGGGSKFV